jgi:hypothetical protein
MKAIPQYATIVRHYPTIKGALTDLVQKESNFFNEARINADVIAIAQPAHHHRILGG